MLVIGFRRADLANVRFAISPLVELQQSVRALHEPDARALHGSWVTETLERVPVADLRLLRALQPRNAYGPDFIHPPPKTPLAGLEDELGRVARTPPAQIRAEIEHAYCGRHIPAVLDPLIDDPKRGVMQLAEVFRSYWELVMAAHWPRLRTLLEADVRYRARRLADGGAQLLFEDVHPEVRFAKSRLLIEKPFDATLALDGRGLLFVPSAFGCPRPAAITRPPWQPTVIYPARGAATLWEPASKAPSQGLAAALGQRRAAVLATLDVPQSTRDLATRLGVVPSSVSTHLGVLRDAGLVTAQRAGRLVLYARSPAGDVLVDTSDV
jgi:DNA-binding transcriptional ArsR family regulator